MTEEVGVNAARLKARVVGQLAQDQEGAGPRQGAAFRVQEELGPVTPVEERAPAGEVTWLKNTRI